MKYQIDEQTYKFGQMLKDYRKKAKVGQQEIADATGLSKNYISSIERGVHKCNAQTLITYAKICKFSLDEMTNIIPKSKLNKSNKMDGLELLSTIGDGIVTTAFLDLEYHGLIDAMHYGNLGVGREKARFQLPQMDEDTIILFVQEIDRVLKASGHLFFWIDKYHLCQGILDWFGGTSLNLVDMLVWNKGRIGMGYRSRRKSEYIVVFQKEPVRAKGCWFLHNIPDVWEEKVEKNHPHAKPIELQKQLILATSKNKNDIILDPAAGGYSVKTACEAVGRTFIGCDIEFGEE